MAIDRIKVAVLADRLEELASRMKTEWANRERRNSNQLEFVKTFTAPTFEEAGGLLEKALQAGAFRDDADFVTEVTRDPSRTVRDGRHRDIFLGLWQRWLPKMGHPYRANNRETSGYDYADALKSFAAQLRGDGHQPACEDDGPGNGDWWATTPPPAGEGWYEKPLIGTLKMLARCVGKALRGDRVDVDTLANMHRKSVWIFRVNYFTWQAYFHNDTFFSEANAEWRTVLDEKAKEAAAKKAGLAKTEKVKAQTGTQKGSKRSKQDQTG